MTDHLHLGPYLPSPKFAGIIRLLRGKSVVLSHDLATLYGVPTFQLNRAVRRNSIRFPDDFMFQLTQEEVLKCQIGISKKPGRGGARRARPFAFTEHGIAMLSSVLNSRRAIRVNIEIIRTFVMLNKALVTNSGIGNRLTLAEARLSKHDAQILTALQLIKQLGTDREPRTLRFIRGDDPKEGDPN